MYSASAAKTLSVFCRAIAEDIPSDLTAKVPPKPQQVSLPFHRELKIVVISHRYFRKKTIPKPNIRNSAALVNTI